MVHDKSPLKPKLIYLNEFHNDLIVYKTRILELQVTRWFPL